MSEYSLKDISTMQTGLILARKKAESGSLHVYKQLTLRSMENDGINAEAITSFYATESLQSDYFSQNGTIVMKLFAPFNPIVITKETEGFLIPSQMVWIKPGKKVLAEYLCFYLSQDFISRRLLENYFWIAQRAITIDSLSNLKIRVPSVKTQKVICDYYSNYRNLCRLRKELDKEEQKNMKYVFSVLSKEKELQQ